MYLPFLNTALWFLPYILVTCLGLFFLKIFRFPLLKFHDLQYAFWLGFAGLIVCLQVIHFFLPITREIALTFVACALVGGVLCGQELWSLIRSITRRDGFFLAGTIVLLDLWIQSQKGYAPVRYDTGLYHLQYIHWLTTFPTVIGLGNLHTRFAFPQTYFFFPAFMDQVFFWMGGFFICSYLFVANIFFEWAWGIRAIVLKADLSQRNFFRALLIFPLVFYACYDSRIITASADAAVFLLGLAMMVLFSRSLEPSLKGVSIAGSLPLFILFFLALVGLTLKPTHVVFASIILFVIGMRGAFRSGLFLVGLLVLIVLGPFLVRNILLSGYPFFPIHFLPFPVDWRIPDVLIKADCTFSYSKTAGCQSIAVTDLSWFGSWLKRNLMYTQVSSYGPLGMIVLGIVLGGRHICNAKAFAFIFPLLSAFLISVFFYPDCRFFGSLFWGIAMAVVSFVFFGTASWLSPRQWKVAVLVLVFVFAGFAIKGAVSARAVRRGVPFNQGQFKIFKMAPDFSVVQLLGPGDRCWATSLFCTPENLDGLRLRDPGHVAAGFSRLEINKSPLGVK